MNQEIARGTRVHAPDLDWSQIRETVLMLELAAGQVEAAMKDSNSSVEVLTDTFTSLADTLQLIDAAIDTLPDTIGNGLVKAEIVANSQLVSAKVHHAIVAFQFYDKLVQRLDHVCHGLAGLSQLVSDQGRLYRPAEWKALQDTILTKYTMVEERAMFESVLKGATVKEALETYMSVRMQEIESSGGEIELF
jgi:hypothetical protein